MVTPMLASAEDPVACAWRVLARVMDPEVPAVSVVDLGIVREVSTDPHTQPPHWTVTLTPTYSGCPATEAIESDVRDAMTAAGFTPLTIRLQRAPAWTSDWISEHGRERLRAYGIAPPDRTTSACAAGATAPPTPVRLIGQLDDAVRRHRASVARAASIACPRCASLHTERLAAFGSTACKALYRCLACHEPFEHFKPI